jgi:hypothetical protein
VAKKANRKLKAGKAIKQRKSLDYVSVSHGTHPNHNELLLVA